MLRFELDSPFKQASDAFAQAVDERTAAACHVQPPVSVRQTIQPFQFRHSLSHSSTHVDRISLPSSVFYGVRILPIVVGEDVRSNAIFVVSVGFQICEQVAVRFLGGISESID
jgi:hypothetical protein